MKSNTIRIATVAAACLVAATSAHALKTEKRDLKNNMSIKYKVTPKAVNSFDEMFSEGVLYGRLRSNMFHWDWAADNNGKTEDNSAWGVGGSLIYSTGYLNGFGATAGLYTTHTIATDNLSDTNNKDMGKAGKDTYNRGAGAGAPIDVLALAYLEYKSGKTSFKAGRQIFESTLLRSNDTKMIPNTFEGFSVDSKAVADTRLRAAYFTRQKLRDHDSFHSIISFNGGGKRGNDDAGKHKGLTDATINAAGEEVNPGMIVLTAQNKSIKGLKLNFDGMYIDGFVSSAIFEANYKMDIGNGWKLIPGARYIHQMDEGAGKIGGAALSGNTGGYSDPSSVDGSAFMARLQLKKGAGKIMAGYSAIADDADIIAMWRGFPTGGYTRSMAQYNWEADTKSYMIKAAYNLGKAGIVEGLRGSLDYAVMDYDTERAGISKTDRSIIHLDVQKTFKNSPNLELKFRAAMIDADQSVGAAEDYNSYNEYRFEVNYLF